MRPSQAGDEFGFRGTTIAYEMLKVCFFEEALEFKPWPTEDKRE